MTMRRDAHIFFSETTVRDKSPLPIRLPRPLFADTPRNDAYGRAEICFTLLHIQISTVDRRGTGRDLGSGKQLSGGALGPSARCTHEGEGRLD